jgi:hypothetical protein
MRDGLLLLHILGVAGWLGGALHAMYTYPATARIGPPKAGEALRGMEKPASIYFGVTSGLVLLSGIVLVLTSDAFGWTDAFVLIGLGAFLITGIIQSAVGKKANIRLTEAAESGEGVADAVKSWRWAGMWDVALLAIVIWAMITKLGV